MQIETHEILTPAWHQEASNIPNEIQVLNWDLIWSLHYSPNEQIIEMITEIKFAIITY